MSKNQTFRQVERIKKNSDFTKIISKGQRYKSEKMTIFVLKSDLPYSRLGVSVSKQLEGAVIRNRLKRLAREVFRKNKNAIKGIYDIVILLRDKIKYKEIEDFFIKVLCND